MMKAILLATMLALGACQTTPQYQVRYTLSPSGDLVQTQVPVPNDNRVLETLAIVGLGIVGMYFVGEAFDVWDDDDPAPPPPAPTNPLVPTGGTQSWSTDFIQPVYQPL